MGHFGTNAGWRYTDPVLGHEVVVPAGFPLIDVEVVDLQRRYERWSATGTTRNVTTLGAGVAQVQARERFISDPAAYRRMLKAGLNGVELEYFPNLSRNTSYPLQLVRIVEAEDPDQVKLVADRDRGRSHGEFEVGLVLRRVDGGDFTGILLPPVGGAPVVSMLIGGGDLSGWTPTRASVAYRRTRSGRLEQVAAGVPRTNWGADGKARTLLELAGTNLVTESENFGLWSVSGTPLLTSGQSDPSGGTAAYLVADDDVSGTEFILRAVTFTGDAQKAVSLFVKEGTSPGANGSDFQLRDTTAAANRLVANLTWSDGAPVVTAAVGTYLGRVKCRDGWWRLLFRTTTVTAANTNQLWIIPAATSANTGNLYVFGAQAENGEHPTSYIKTEGSTVTRAVDTVSRTLPAGTALPIDSWARYTRFAYLGNVADAYVWHVGAGLGSGSAPIMRLDWRPTGLRLAYRQDGLTTISSTIGFGAIQRGDVVETNVDRSADGSATLSLSVNGAFIGSATLAARALGSAWSGGPVTYINSRDGGNNTGAMELEADLFTDGIPAGSHEAILRQFRARIGVVA